MRVSVPSYPHQHLINLFNLNYSNRYVVLSHCVFDLYFPIDHCGEGNGSPLQYSCLENPRDRGAWWAAAYGVAQTWTRLKQLSMHACIHALEKEMATHSSILAWRIPGTGELGGLPSMELHRVGDD